MSNILAFIASAMLVVPAQPQGCAMDSTASWVQVNRAWSTGGGGRWANDSLRRVLLAMEREDQEPRKEFAARSADTSYQRQMMELDRRLSASLAEILDRYGLPTRSMVGALGSSAVFTMAQHSQSLQERVLAMAKQAPPGEVAPHLLATLEDRVLVRQGRPQRFGTHFSFSADGRLRFDVVEDASGLTTRRHDAGLPPMDLYVCMLEEGGLRIDRSSVPPKRH